MMVNKSMKEDPKKYTSYKKKINDVNLQSSPLSIMILIRTIIDYIFFEIKNVKRQNCSNRFSNSDTR